MGVGQVFIFIVAALTFALVMIFGYRAVVDFLARGEQIEFLQFKNDLENSIKKIYTEYGALRQETFFLPGKYGQICFVDFDQPYNPGLCSQDPIACSFWKDADSYDATDENVFLQPVAPVLLKIFRFQVIPRQVDEAGFLCLPISGGTFTIMLEGKG